MVHHHRGVCQQIEKVLDSIYLSEVPFPYHVAQAVRRVLRGKVMMDITDQEVLKGDEALLNHTNMMALCHDQQIDTGLLHKAITNQVSQQQTHSHMETCKKGVLGHTGCCLSMPFGNLSTTSPVVLKPIKTDGEANDSYTGLSSNVQQRTVSETLKYDIQNPRMHNIIPRVELLPLTDIHNWKTDIAVVWETHRPCHQEHTLASVPHSTSNEVEQSENSMFTGE